jgi:hypothetical protein
MTLLLAIFGIVGFIASLPFPPSFLFPLLFLCVAFFVFFIGLRTFLNAYNLCHSRGFLYENGYMVVKCAGEQIVASETIHWRDIAIIWHDVKRSTSSHRSSSGFSSKSTTITHTYTFQRWDGNFFGNVIGNNEGKMNNRVLGKHIEQMTLPYLIPQAISIYRRGFPVNFGPLVLHMGGIEYQGRFLPWSDFDCLNMNESYGTLSILQKGSPGFGGFKKPWATLPYIQVPNLAVLYHLILSITGSAHP